MSFKLFIYYCAICGGWAAFLTWAVVQAAGVLAVENVYLEAALIAALLGLLVAGAVGGVDALQNAVGVPRVVRVLVCLGVGLLGGLLGGLVGEALHQQAAVLRVVGWMVVGAAIGVALGVFDLLRAVRAGEDARAGLRKARNGLLGGLLGGFVGGLLFGGLLYLNESGAVRLPRSSLAVGLVVLGLCIGLFIGLAQVILKEAWLRVEAGFRAGRELLLAKDQTTVGRAESCDLGLFGDPQVEKLHARVVLKGGRYHLADAGTDAGTYLNDQRVTQPAPLKDGDVIRVGRSRLRFGERQKRK
jgi:hypothetical protein